MAKKKRIDDCSICGTRMTRKNLMLRSELNARAWLGSSYATFPANTHFRFNGQFCAEGCQRYYGAVMTMRGVKVREYNGVKIEGFSAEPVPD